MTALISADDLHSGPTLGSLYRQAFKAFPKRPALVDGNAGLSYAELEARCNQTARYLQSLELRPQSGIGLLSGNTADAVVMIIAAQLAGLRLIPLHPMSSEQDQIFVLQDAGAEALVIDTRNYHERGQLLASHGVVKHVLTLGEAPFGIDALASSATMDPTGFPVPGGPRDICKISYTGGTTGKSKGVVQTHRTSVTMLMQQLSTWEWPRKIRFLAATPLSHAAGSYLLPTLLQGGTMVLMAKFTPEDYLRTVHEQQITCSFLVPSQIYSLLDAPASVRRIDSRSLERLWYGASPIAPARLTEAINAFGPIFAQIYGQAEAPMTITYLRSDEHDLERPHLMSSCGRVVVGNEVRLLDKHLRDVAPGEVGELCVRGPLLMEGYLNRPDETATTLEGNWLHTGDMARQDEEGFLYLVDRAKDMIVTGGFNVYSSEVESCLAQHPAVASSAVIGTPDPKWGEAVTAVVMLKPECQADAAELMRFVSERKGPHMAPKIVDFATTLPMTAVGKVDKKSLRNRYWGAQSRQIA